MITGKYPLNWPPGWNRTRRERRDYGRFKTTYTKTMDRLEKELNLLGAKAVFISSNLPLRKDGSPRADVARMRIEDPGVAVYFTLRGKPMVMARDGYASVYDNLHSMQLAVAHLRGLERHGGGSMMERAFEGFVALPAPSGQQAKTWRELLGFLPDAHPTLQEVNAHYRDRIRRLGPDGNSDFDFSVLDLNHARAEAKKELGA